MVQYKVRIDKQGRIVIPSEIRRKLGLKPNMELVLVVRGKSLLLEPNEEEVERAIDEWYRLMLETKVMVKGFSSGESKWMSDEYVRKKLGFD